MQGKPSKIQISPCAYSRQCSYQRACKAMAKDASSEAEPQGVVKEAQLLSELAEIPGISGAWVAPHANGHRVTVRSPLYSAAVPLPKSIWACHLSKSHLHCLMSRISLSLTLSTPKLLRAHGRGEEGGGGQLPGIFLLFLLRRCSVLHPSAGRSRRSKVKSGFVALSRAWLLLAGAVRSARPACK